MKFNFYSSIPFWIAVWAVVISVRILDRKPKIRSSWLLVTSLLMILSIPGFTLPNLAGLLVLAAFSYGFGYLLMRPLLPAPPNARRLAATIGIAGVLAFLAFYKYGFVQSLLLSRASIPEGSPPRVLFMIGVSYFSFKMIHFIVEAYRKKIGGMAVLDYFTYILFFVPFISGPINRFNQFAQQTGQQVPTSIRKDLAGGSERIVHGLFKKLVLVQIIHPYVLGNPTQDLASLSLGPALLGLYAYAFYFYFDFSGYSDLAIGTARLMGIELPENFDNPFLRRNIRELWTNWHMSLTSWLVDYIYWPLVRKLRALQYFRDHPVVLSNTGMIITFLACGMWHGEAVNFLIWGGYHGLGISALTIYQRQKKKIKNPSLQRYFQSRLSAVVGAFFTFNFFAIGLVLFVLDIKSLAVLIRAILS